MTEKKQILVIEDDEDVRNSLVRHLEYWGFYAWAAEDGEEGLRLAMQVLPNLIILDLSIPKLPGSEVCKTLKENQDKRYRQIPIIMLTGRVDEADQVLGRVIGASFYMTKPFRAEDLLEQINRFT